MDFNQVVGGRGGGGGGGRQSGRGGRGRGRGRGGGGGDKNSSQQQQQQQNPFASKMRPTMKYDNNNPTSQINKLLGGSGEGGGGLGGGAGGVGMISGPPPSMVRNSGQMSRGSSPDAGVGRKGSPFQGRGNGKGGSGRGKGGNQINQSQSGASSSPFGNGQGGNKFLGKKSHSVPGRGMPSQQTSPRSGGITSPSGAMHNPFGSSQGQGMSFGYNNTQPSQGNTASLKRSNSPRGNATHIAGGAAAKSFGSNQNNNAFLDQSSQSLSPGRITSSPRNISPRSGKGARGRGEQGGKGQVSGAIGGKKAQALVGSNGGAVPFGGGGGGSPFGSSKKVVDSSHSPEFGKGKKNQNQNSNITMTSPNNNPALSDMFGITKSQGERKESMKGKGVGRGMVNQVQDSFEASESASIQPKPAGKSIRGSGRGRGNGGAGQDNRHGSPGGKGSGAKGRGGGRGKSGEAASSSVPDAAFGKGGKGGKRLSGGVLSCRVCQATFTNKTEMFAHLESEQHFDSNTSPPPYSARSTVQSPPRNIPTCQKCGLTFPSRNKLRTHLIESQHFNTEPSYSNPSESRPRKYSGVPDEDAPGPLFQNKVWVPDQPPAPPANTEPPSGIKHQVVKGKLSVKRESASPDGKGVKNDKQEHQQQKDVKDIAQVEFVHHSEEKPVVLSKTSPKMDLPTPPMARAPSIRPDGTVRKEFRERKAGYTPQEEVPAYVPPHLRDGPKSNNEPLSVSRAKSEAKAPSKEVRKPVPKSVKRNVNIALRKSNPKTPLVGGNTRHSDGGIIGQCVDMCPASERSRDGNNPRKIDVLEESLDLSVSALPGEEQHFMDHKYTMIKKYEKSSADRNMAQPEIVRTPATLLRTLQFMEQNVMDVDRQVCSDEGEDDDSNYGDDSTPRGPGKYHVHNFVWDRMRSIYGDFIVQNYRLGGRVDAYCVECHERMARWHLMMEHHIQWDAESHRNGFDRQNSERYISILKSLDEFYNMVHILEENEPEEPPNGTNRPFFIPNEGELRSYFILYQMDNQGASEKYLKRLRPEVLDHPDIQFALKVMQARRSENYGKFFRLLRNCNYLQACAMFRFVPPMRLHALKTINRVMRPGRNEASFSVEDLLDLMCFNDAEDVLEYLEYFDFETTSHEEKNGKTNYSVILHGNSLELRYDEDGKEINPPLQFMTKHIESKLKGHDRADVTRGVLSNAVIFEGETEDFTLIEDGISGGEEEEEVDTEVESEVDDNVRSPSIVETIRVKMKRGDTISSAEGEEETESQVVVESKDTAALELAARKAAASEKLLKFKEQKELKEQQRLKEERVQQELEMKSIAEADARRRESESNRVKNIKEQQELQQRKTQQKLKDEQLKKQAIEAEVTRKALEQEKARAQALQRQKEIDAENFRAKEEALKKLANKCILNVESRILSQTWSVWQDLTVNRLKEMREKQLRLIFTVWRRQYLKIEQRREKLDSQLKAINFKSPQQVPKKRNLRSTYRQRLSSRKRVAPFYQDHLFISVFGGQKTSLPAAKFALFRDLSLQSPFCSPSLAVGSGLLQIQSNYLQTQLHGEDSKPQLSTSDSVWSQDLFFHLGVVSSCRKFQKGTLSAAKTWDHNHCILPNILRALLSSDCDESTENSDATSTMGIFEGRTPCYLDIEHNQYKRYMRDIHMRVEDHCVGSFEESATSVQNISHELSAALVILPDIIPCLRAALCTSASTPENVPNIKLKQLLRSLTIQSHARKRTRTPETSSISLPPTTDMSGDEDLLESVESFLSNTLDACVSLIESNTPIVVLITSEVIDFNVTLTKTTSFARSGPSRSDKPAIFEELDHSGVVDQLLLQLFVDMLCKRTDKNITNIVKCFSLQANFLNSDLYNTKSELFSSQATSGSYSNLSDIVSTCGRCLFSILDSLALATGPMPLVERVDIASWAEEVMLNSLWRSGIGEEEPTMVVSEIESEHLDLTIDQVLCGLIKNVNNSLDNECVRRVKFNQDAAIEGENEYCVAKFPFDIGAFSFIEKKCETRTQGCFGMEPVKGLLYNNASDRWTPSCGPISTVLPELWSNVDHMKAVSDNILKDLFLPEPQSANRFSGRLEYEIAICQYSNLLSSRGWDVEFDLGRRLNDVLDCLRTQLETFRTGVNFEKTLHDDDDGNVVLSQSGSFVHSELLEQWRRINLNILTLKRLLGRVIQLQCNAVSEKTFIDDSFLVVLPHSFDFSRTLDRGVGDKVAGSFLCPSCPPPLVLSANDSKLPVVNSGDEDFHSETRYKRRLGQEHDYSLLVDSEGDGYIKDAQSQFDFESNFTESSIKKTRYDDIVNTAESFPLTSRDKFYHDMYGDVKDLGEACKLETENVASFENKLANALLENSADTSFSSEVDAHGIIALASDRERSRFSFNNSHNSLLYPTDNYYYRDGREFGSPLGIGESPHSLRKENISINEQLSPVSALDMIKQFRQDRLNSDAWMENMTN